MLRQFKITLLLITLFSLVLIALIYRSFDTSAPDGFEQISKNDHNHLEEILGHVDLASMLHAKSATVDKIQSAYRNHVGECAIRASVLVNGKAKKCCIFAVETPHYDFILKCVQCDQYCTCFDK